MEIDILQNIQNGLNEKRQNITEFLESASKVEKELCSCEDEQGIQAHLHVIEINLEKIKNETLGICQVCHGYVDPSLLEMDYTACICLDHYSPDEMRKLEAELELSQIVQRALLPQKMPQINGVELAAFSRPSDIIGGDYFDFFKFKDGTHGIVIADVSGHGVSAAMLMSSLQTALRTMAPDTNSPAEIIERINRFYIHNIHFVTFVTVFLARFDPATRTLEFVNAGHNPPALFNKQTGETTWLMPTAPSVGLMEAFYPRTDSVTLSEGDVLLLYTDGVTEVMNECMEQFGQNRLIELVQQNTHLSPPDLIQLVRQGIRSFNENKELQDDVTIITLKMS
jgi:sigma-B regulation protein RsbU (phosphoserine phosphatase)